MANGTVADEGTFEQENEDYPVADWKYEVANGDTRLGYWEWVEHQIESNKNEN